MESVLFDETKDSPLVKFDKKTGKIIIEGKSTLVDPVHFYKKLVTELGKYQKNKRARTTLAFRLSYINTASSKWILHMLRTLENKNQTNASTFVEWYHEYDDEAVQEAGEVYQSLVNIPFRIISENY